MLINSGAAHPIRLVFWGEGNGPVTLGEPQVKALVGMPPAGFFKLRCNLISYYRNTKKIVEGSSLRHFGLEHYI